MTDSGCEEERKELHEAEKEEDIGPPGVHLCEERVGFLGLCVCVCVCVCVCDFDTENERCSVIMPGHDRTSLYTHIYTDTHTHTHTHTHLPTLLECLLQQHGPSKEERNDVAHQHSRDDKEEGVPLGVCVCVCVCKSE